MPFPRSISIALASALLLSCASDPAATSSFLIDSVDASSSGSFTLFDETRRALKTPVGERITVVVEVPPSPVMRFAIAASTMGNPVLASAVTFRLSVDGQVVFEDIVRRSQPNRWYRRELDLSTDPGEKTNLAASQPDEVLRFRSIVRDYLREVSELESSRDEVTLDERTLEQLKALGYVEP